MLLDFRERTDGMIFLLQPALFLKSFPLIWTEYARWAAMQYLSVLFLSPQHTDTTPLTIFMLTEDLAVMKAFPNSAGFAMRKDFQSCLTRSSTTRGGIFSLSGISRNTERKASLPAGTRISILSGKANGGILSITMVGLVAKI